MLQNEVSTMTEHFHRSKSISKEKLKSLIERKDHPAILRFSTLYLLFVLASIWVILSWDGVWWNWLLSQLGFGLLCCSMFAVEHETVHGTAFKTKRGNQIAASLAGLAHLYPSSIFRELHFMHHRHTHIPGLDPEISLGNQPGPAILQNPPIYLVWLTGFPLLSFKIMMLIFGALGMPEFARSKLYPFINPKRRRMIAMESILVLGFTAMLIGLALFVHAGFHLDIGFEKTLATNKNDLLWDRSLYKTALEIWHVDNNLSRMGKQKSKVKLGDFDNIFVGHTPTTNDGFYKPTKMGNLINLDQGCKRKGILTIWELETDLFYQNI